MCRVWVKCFLYSCLVSICVCWVKIVWYLMCVMCWWLGMVNLVWMLIGKLVLIVWLSGVCSICSCVWLLLDLLYVIVMIVLLFLVVMVVIILV